VYGAKSVAMIAYERLNLERSFTNVSDLRGPKVSGKARVSKIGEVLIDGNEGVKL
jgi:hypothetical protein